MTTIYEVVFNALYHYISIKLGSTLKGFSSILYNTGNNCHMLTIWIILQA